MEKQRWNDEPSAMRELEKLRRKCVPVRRFLLSDIDDCRVLVKKDGIEPVKNGYSQTANRGYRGYQMALLDYVRQFPGAEDDERLPRTQPAVN